MKASLIVVHKKILSLNEKVWTFAKEEGVFNLYIVIAGHTEDLSTEGDELAVLAV